MPSHKNSNTACTAIGYRCKIRCVCVCVYYTITLHHSLANECQCLQYPILCSVFLHLSPLTTSVGVLEDPPSPSSQFAVSKSHDASVVADGGCINHDQDTKPMAAQALASGTLIGLQSFDLHLAVPGIQ